MQRSVTLVCLDVTSASSESSFQTFRSDLFAQLRAHGQKEKGERMKLISKRTAIIPVACD